MEGIFQKLCVREDLFLELLRWYVGYLWEFSRIGW